MVDSSKIQRTTIVVLQETMWVEVMWVRLCGKKKPKSFTSEALPPGFSIFIQSLFGLAHCGCVMYKIITHESETIRAANISDVSEPTLRQITSIALTQVIKARRFF